MQEKLMGLYHKKIQVLTNSFYVGYALVKGVLVEVKEDYIEVDSGGKFVIIPISNIVKVEYRERA
jgi:hypothetical protein